MLQPPSLDGGFSLTRIPSLCGLLALGAFLEQSPMFIMQLSEHAVQNGVALPVQERRSQLLVARGLAQLDERAVRDAVRGNEELLGHMRHRIEQGLSDGPAPLLFELGLRSARLAHEESTTLRLNLFGEDFWHRANFGVLAVRVVPQELLVDRERLVDDESDSEVFVSAYGYDV